jgi:hypothetical protein
VHEIRAGSYDGFDFLAEAREVGGQNRRCYPLVGHDDP